MLVATIRHLVADRPVRILDVGCGNGLFFDALQHFGDVTGIESDPVSLTHDNPWADRIICGELDERYAPPAPFDLILMLDVLEHASNPENLLRHAARVLDQGGRILITVPAFQWLWTSHDDINHHRKRYTAEEVRCLIEQAGLVVHESRYLFQSLVLPKLAVRASEALASPRSTLPHIPGPIVSTALQTWFWAEFHLLAPLPFGTSVLAVAGLATARTKA
jgi:SAM-dependent methyltransferase